MPSPFPGMDPYIEGQAWPDFHHQYMSEIARALVKSVRPRYMVRAEERVYLEHDPEPDRTIRPDVAVLADPSRPGPQAGGGVAIATGPVLVTLPMPEEVHEHFLQVMKPDTLDVVTVIELLSPANKRPGSDGQREYLDKRERVLRSGTHLVEIDLLRGGARLPMRGPVPASDYLAVVCRCRQRPGAHAYPMALRQPLPTIPVPLDTGDPDAPLDLQAAFNAVYDESGYDYSLRYDLPVMPPLPPSDATWVAHTLSARHA